MCIYIASNTAIGLLNSELGKENIIGASKLW